MKPTDLNIWAAALAQRTVRGTTCRASEVYDLATALVKRLTTAQIEEVIDLVATVRMTGESFKDAGMRVAQMIEECDAEGWHMT